MDQQQDFPVTVVAVGHLIAVQFQELQLVHFDGVPVLVLTRTRDYAIVTETPCDASVEVSHVPRLRLDYPPSPAATNSMNVRSPWPAFVVSTSG